MSQLADPCGQARKVLMGTCGWSDHTLLKCERFYPASVHTAEDRLRHYSTHFPCVEVDTSTYAIPSISSIKGWLRCVPKGFLFHFKAFGLFCSKSCPFTALPVHIRSKMSVTCPVKNYINLETLSESLRDEVWQTFNDRLRIAYEAGNLGVVVFQFHLSFKPTKENQVHVEWCRQNLDSRFSMAVEFRCRDWFTGQYLASTLEWLKKTRLALVAADELKHETFQKDRHQTGLPKGQNRVTLPVAWALTQPDFMYIRVHRREGNQRLLSEAELSIWENRLKFELSPDLKGPVYFMWGTDWEDQPLINARSLNEKLGDLVYNWKISQRKLASFKGLENFFTGKGEEDAVKQSSEVPGFLCKAGERNEKVVDGEQLKHLNHGNLQSFTEDGPIVTELDVVALNLKTSAAQIVKKDCVTHPTSTALGVRRKQIKTVKRQSGVSSQGSLSAITMYFQKN